MATILSDRPDLVKFCGLLFIPKDQETTWSHPKTTLSDLACCVLPFPPPSLYSFGSGTGSQVPPGRGDKSLLGPSGTRSESPSGTEDGEVSRLKM